MILISWDWMVANTETRPETFWPWQLPMVRAAFCDTTDFLSVATPARRSSANLPTCTSSFQCHVPTSLVLPRLFVGSTRWTKQGNWLGYIIIFLRVFLGGSVLSVQTRAELYQPSWASCALCCGSRGECLGARAGGQTEWVLLTVAWPWGELSVETRTTLKRLARFATCECCSEKGNEPVSEQRNGYRRLEKRQMNYLRKTSSKLSFLGSQDTPNRDV